MTNTDRTSGFQIRFFRIPGWQIALVVAGVLAIALALAVVATGLFLIALPVAFLGGLAWRLLGGRSRPSPARSRDGGPAVIDADYEVIAPTRAFESERPPR